nr:uncharacterized protein LOC112730680 [Arachis hypogaea]
MELVDLALSDRMFTWFRGQSCSHIDRVLVSLEWVEEFPDIRLKGGPRGLSDHCPLIVDVTRVRVGPRPFRSLDSWFTHEGFLQTVREEWRRIGDVQFIDKLKALMVPLGRWHRDNFGNMDGRITRFEEEIKKVDDLVSNGVYDGTMEARRKALVSSCKIWYMQKELHWKQLPRSRHAKEMDRNTRYFHNLASARRRNNRIDALMINGSNVEATELESLPSVEEIKDAVWDCGSTKAPGSDGYNMNFIKKCWEEVGREFTEAVMGFFQSATLPRDSNITWVALARKFVSVKEIKDLRAISMVGCVYKVISKVLVRRMRKVMPGLVGETQSAFVNGRKIHDGALIACKTVHWLKSRKKSSAIIKLDFQKAYDRVKWSFVDIVLHKMGFGLKWREWIKECVCSTSMSILINGSPSKPFKMERGLRQGDPLSPFLFVLVVDVLHRMIGEAVRNGRIAPLLVGRDDIELSHLQFADDTILLCPPEEATIRNYKRLLRCFEVMSGLSINFEKSSFIPVNCEQRWTRKMCSLLDCKEASLPVRYLGISLGANPRLVKTWKPVVDKVEEKLSLWKAKTLNKVGKLVLIKSVLNSLPIYYLSLYKMPKAVAEKLISLQRRFLWSKEDGRHGMPLVKWDLVMASKKKGGLGVGNVVARNAALLFKWWWRFSKEDYHLWKKVVCSCNHMNPSEMLSVQRVPTRGGPWKDICLLQISESQVREKMISGLSMELGNGRRIRFWEDRWLPSGALKDEFSRLFSVSNLNGSVIGDWGVLGWDRVGLDFSMEKRVIPMGVGACKVLQAETLPGEIQSYSFTSTIWRGFIPPRIELFACNFDDIFDEDFFIETLGNRVHVVRELPSDILQMFNNNTSNIVNLRVKAWSSPAHYLQKVLPQLLEMGCVFFPLCFLTIGWPPILPVGFLGSLPMWRKSPNVSIQSHE